MSSRESAAPGAEDAAPLLMHSTVRISITDGPDKLVWLPCEDRPVPMGMHDELARHYKADPTTFDPHASTLDYLVGAIAACLTGTLKRALVARGIHVGLEDLRTDAVGEIVLQREVPVVQSVAVRYRLAGTQPEQRERIERAHAVHHRACAVSRSVEDAIDITSTLQFV